MLDNQPLNGFSNYKMNSHNELVSQKSRRVKLMGLHQHLRLEVLQRNGFVRFKLDGRVFVFFHNCHHDVQNNFYLLFKVFEQFY